MEQIESRLDDLNRNAPIMLICRIGGSSCLRLPASV